MTEQEYRQAEGVNKSTLWNLRKSPAHYKYFLENQREDTAAFAFGRAVHAAILTPSAFKKDFVVIPEGIDRRTKAGKEEYQAFLDASAGKEILTAADAETVKAIVKAFKKNRDAVQLLKGTKREKPLFWTDDNGIFCKCRIDAYKAGLIVDLKTAQDAETETFTKEALRYGYDVQAAHYLDAYQHKESAVRPEWYFIVIEKAEPYAINILRADIGFLDYGFIRRQELIEKLKVCQDQKAYPDYGINELCLPAWAEGSL
jgi:exodeoxyribonuclease VIII